MGERITFLGKLIPKLWNIFCRRILAREAIFSLENEPETRGYEFRSIYYIQYYNIQD